MHSADDVDALLKARAEIDEQLRKHKNALTVLFTDVVGSTSFFERNGDTAGLVMIHRHDELAARAIQEQDGRVIKTIGDSAMAEFPDPASAVRAAVEIERQFLKLNLTLPEDQRVEVRIGVHTGVGFRKGDDLFGDVVNVTARVVKRTAPAQILISRAVYEAVSKEADLHCRWLSKFTIDGRTEKEDIFEVVWTDVDAYRDMQDRLAASSHIPPRYEVISQIGTGGTGIVYKVRDLETSEIVALKILKPEIASDPDVQENFKRELCLARKITHKNVCRIHEFNRLNGTTYTSMELVEGESLLSRLNRSGALPLSEALAIARQICAGLREAHEQGIVHRDLKPGNIMLDRGGNVKIMDFGIARMIQRDGPMTGTIVGTPAYMAPEQAELKPISSSTDIYALGLLLYEMITGVAAFSGDTPVAVALKQIREYPKRPREIVPQLSRPVDSVIMKCLQKDPAKRFQSVDQLEIALVRASKARPIPDWEVALNRGLVQAELSMRRQFLEGVEKAEEFLRPQQGRVPAAIHEEPKAMLGFAGVAGALIVFLFVGGWKPRTINAQTVPAVSQKLVVTPAAAENDSASGSPTYPAPNSFEPIASNDVDLYANVRAKIANTSSSAPALPVQNSGPVSLAPSAPSAKPSRDIVKQPKLPSPTVAKKAKLDAHASTATQLAAAPAQSESVTTADASNSAAPEPEVNSARLDSAPKPVFESAYVATEPATPVGATKTPNSYLEVGTFKDETWANSAADKLRQLGFHVVLIHKNLLWSQSYHVQVGPYASQKEIADARQSLVEQGFKAHPVN